MTSDEREIRVYLKQRYSPKFVQGKSPRQLYAIYRSCIDRDKRKNQVDGQLSIFDITKEEPR
jgi:hypothetical protein